MTSIMIESEVELGGVDLFDVWLDEHTIGECVLCGEAVTTAGEPAEMHGLPQAFHGIPGGRVIDAGLCHADCGFGARWLIS